MSLTAAEAQDRRIHVYNMRNGLLNITKTGKLSPGAIPARKAEEKVSYGEIMCVERTKGVSKTQNAYCSIHVSVGKSRR